jgi:hypothetical protein
MEKQFNENAVLEGVDESRRGFVKKVLIGTAFAVPVINSFSMDGLKLRIGEHQAGAEGQKGFDRGGADMAVAPPPPVSPS